MLLFFSCLWACGKVYVFYHLKAREPLTAVETYYSSDGSAKLVAFSPPKNPENRIPLVMAGGMGGNFRSWHEWLKRLNRDEKENYVLYDFGYDSSKFPIRENGAKLDECLKKAGIKNPLYMAHSSGGHIIRSCQIEQRKNSDFRAMIAIAVPWHGVPTLIKDWAVEGVKTVFPFMWKLIVGNVYNVSQPGLEDLRWDNYDYGIPKGCSDYLNEQTNKCLFELNQKDTNWEKYYAIAGNRSLENIESTFPKYMLLAYATLWKMLFIEDIFVHNELTYGALLMASIPNKKGDIYESDGVVPVGSALGAELPIMRDKEVFEGYDHEDLMTMSRDPEDKLYKYVKAILDYEAKKRN